MHRPRTAAPLIQSDNFPLTGPPESESVVKKSCFFLCPIFSSFSLRPFFLASPTLASTQ